MEIYTRNRMEIYTVLKTNAHFFYRMFYIVCEYVCKKVVSVRLGMYRTFLLYCFYCRISCNKRMTHEKLDYIPNTQKVTYLSTDQCYKMMFSAFIITLGAWK